MLSIQIECDGVDDNDNGNWMTEDRARAEWGWRDTTKRQPRRRRRRRRQRTTAVNNDSRHERWSIWKLTEMEIFPIVVTVSFSVWNHEENLMFNRAYKAHLYFTPWQMNNNTGSSSSNDGGNGGGQWRNNNNFPTQRKREKKKSTQRIMLIFRKIKLARFTSLQYFTFLSSNLLLASP